MEAPELRVVSVDDVHVNERNPRRISERGLEKLESSIERFGFVSPILVQRETMTIIAGHQRLKAAREKGLTEVPVVLLDMSDEDALAYNLADNRLAEEAEWDVDLLVPILREADDELRAAMGFDSDEIDKFFDMERAASATGFLDDIAGEVQAPVSPTRTESEYLTIAYAVTPDQRETIDQALRMAKERYEVPTNAEALVAICDEFVRRA